MPRKQSPETILKKELKAAIDAGDWDKAEKITALLKGEKPSEQKPLITAPQLKTETAYERYKPNRVPPPSNPIPFVDDGTQCVEDKEISKILANKSPVARIRPSSITIARCSSCKKDIEVSIKLLDGRSGEEGADFICDRCLTGFKR